VAWTRMRAPRSLMDTIGPDAIRAAAQASPLQAEYGQTVDRDSAYERLNAKLSPPQPTQAPAADPSAPATRRSSGAAACQRIGGGDGEARDRTRHVREGGGQRGVQERHAFGGHRARPRDHPQHLRYRPPPLIGRRKRVSRRRASCTQRRRSASQSFAGNNPWPPTSPWT